MEQHGERLRMELGALLIAINENYSSKMWSDAAIRRLVSGITERWKGDRLELVLSALKDLEQGKLKRTQLGSMLPGEVYAVIETAIGAKVFRLNV